MTEECIKELIDLRYECAIADCSECRYSIGGEYNCCFNGIPADWYDLEELLKHDNNRTHELKIFGQYYNDILNKGKRRIAQCTGWSTVNRWQGAMLVSG